MRCSIASPRREERRHCPGPCSHANLAFRVVPAWSGALWRWPVLVANVPCRAVGVEKNTTGRSTCYGERIVLRGSVNPLHYERSYDGRGSGKRGPARPTLNAPW